MDQIINPVGDLIREWRTRRRMSQLDLAGEAEISQRHLSFVESGRAAPSREMVMRLAEGLDMPLRQRNRLLLAAGFAPHYSERPLADPTLAPAMETVAMVLKGHEPCPALAIDRHWNMVAANAAIQPLLAGVSDLSLLEPPVNVLRLSLHPKGIAPQIVNLAEWKAHLLEAELRAYPGGVSQTRIVHNEGTAIAHMMRLRVGETVLSFISTTTVFGTPLDVTLSELAIESFFPVDETTRMALQGVVAG